MKKVLTVIVLLFTLLFAKDSDFDGVPDKFDKCPDTPFLALVDKDGCPIKKIHFKKYRLYIGQTNTYASGNLYKLYFTGAKIQYDNYLLEGYFSKLKYFGYTDTYSKYLALGYKYKKYTIKLKQYFNTKFKNNYINLFLGYSGKISLILEHKFKNSKYNDSFTVLKKIRYKNFKFGIYDYNYLNKNYNFVGSYVSYYFNDNFYLTVDFYKSTNKTRQKNLTFIINYKY